MERDPVAMLQEVQHRLADPSSTPLQSAELLTLEAIGYDLIDDDAQGRAAVDAAQQRLGALPDGAVKSALRFQLGLIWADTAHVAEQLREALNQLKALEATLPVRSIDRACLLIVRSRVNTALTNGQDATADALVAHRIAQALGAQDVAADAAYQLAMSYANYGLFDDAEKLAAEATDFHRAEQLPTLLSNDLWISGEIHTRMHQFGTALAELTEARAINSRYQESVDIAFDNAELCSLLVAMHQVARAIETCRQAEPLLRGAGRTDMYARVEDELAVADLLQHRPAAAIDRLDAMLRDPSAEIQDRTLRGLYRHRADARAQLGDYRGALQDMRELFRREAATESGKTDLKTERVMMELRQFVIQQENAALAAQVQRQRAAALAQQSRLQANRALAAVAFLCAGLIAFVMWYRARRERAKRRQREMLLKEIHHRVKNNLQIISSLLNLQARALEQPAVREFAESSQDRIRSMALVHEHLYQSARLDRVSMKPYLTRLVDIICIGHASGRSIRCEVDTDELELSTDQASTCGLIVNEIATNAFKHAFPDGAAGLIRVSIRQRDGGLVELVIRDDGIGYAPGSLGAAGESFGMRLVEMLVSQLEGRLHVRRSGGTEFRLEFPAAA